MKRCKKIIACRALLITNFIPGLLLALAPFISVFAQPSLSRLQTKLQLQGSVSQTGLDFKMICPTQAGFFFGDNTNLTDAQVIKWIEDQLEIRPDADMFRINNNAAKTGTVEVKKLQQYYRGIKVEFGVINITGKGGKIAMMQMEFYTVKDDFNIRPALTEKVALQKAIEFTGAEKYEWTNADDAAGAANAPQGELVIIKDYQQENEVCLAYKFEITAVSPFSSAYVYVNAMDGRIILNNSEVKHSSQNISAEGKEIVQQGKKCPITNDPKNLITMNSGSEQNIGSATTTKNSLQNYANIQGSAATKFNGTQFLYTDNQSGIAGKPFRLRATRNGVNIETYNMLGNAYNSSVDSYGPSIDFVDNDNNWTAAEYHNPQWDDAALDVQFAMQIVSDYWWLIHGRRGWDNNNSPIKSYVHAYELKKVNNVWNNYFFKNACWWRKKMTFGDGGNSSSSLPYTSLDISAHEMGHAITETTCDLIYQWESGAMNEAFSDIWAACITDYAKHLYPVSNELTWRVSEKSENVGTANPGFRDMFNPGLYGDPSAYKNPNWKPASLELCRDFASTDNCGVHTNSGVLNKWFYLITDGQQGTNSFGTPFNVTGLGFPTSEKIAYLTSLNLTPNATYQTCRTVSLNATATLYGNTSAEYQTVWNAWVAVAVDSNVYNKSNTPVFATNNFTSIAVGKNGVVMAGTNYSGIYKYQNRTWSKMPDLLDVRFNDIKADYYGNFWIAQSGRAGTQGGGSSIAGGVSYYQSPFTSPSTLYTVGAQNDVPSRNARCMYIDTFRNLNLISPSVWVATTAFITSNNSKSGMLGHGINIGTPAFTNVSDGINISIGTVGCLTLGGNKDVIWTFVQANYGVNQLLTYNAVTNAKIETFDHNTHPTIPSGFVARSIYCDSKKRTWIGLATGGIIVYDEKNQWHYLAPADFPQLFPAGAQASYNAIAGTKEGDVYFGTTNGLVFFERGDGLPDKIDQAGSYKAFGKANGLPSNVINAIAFDTLRFKLLVATDSGIVFWEPLCVSPYCLNYKFNASVEVESVAAGNWSNASTWNTGKVPDSATDVTIRHSVTVDVNGSCNSITVNPGAIITVQPGKNLTIYTKGSETIYTGSQRRRRR